ncbi:SDR family NAD(P)-dependent oxidoreductase [Streptomyces sp. CA-111067]|uniref:SDR family NAD(P)-dependent oxidoreductase n=1 Tax=Streptomyces sp. CA-111067 TaxID=3240046 RepID=UPI003D99C269
MTRPPLAGTVAMVTGAGSDIGSATARALAAKGAALALVGPDSDSLAALAEKIREGGGFARTYPTDLTDEIDAEHAVERAVVRSERLDILVNTAGLLLPLAASGASLPERDRVIELNTAALMERSRPTPGYASILHDHVRRYVSGVLHLTEAALPHLASAAQRHHRAVADLVSIHSLAVSTPDAAPATTPSYAPWLQALERELADQRVRVSAVSPGALAVHATGSVPPRERKGHASFITPSPDDIAAAVALIVTRPPASSINAVNIEVTTVRAY